MCRPGKEQLRPVGAGVTVQPGVSSRAPDVRCSSKARVSRDTVKMMEIPRQQYQQGQQNEQYQPEQQ
jgi:hypothetical protein